MPFLICEIMLNFVIEHWFMFIVICVFFFLKTWIYGEGI